MTAADALTIAHPNFGNDPIVLVPTNGGRTVIVSRRQWLTALPLAALGGWDASPPRYDTGLRLFGAAGQTLEGETAVAIAAGIRRSVARLVAGEAKADELLDTRHTVLDVERGGGLNVTRSLFAPFAELVPLVRRTVPGEAENLRHVRALVALADALESLGSATMLSEVPADWISPDEPTVRVVVSAHPSTGCAYTVAGFARAAGDVVTIRASELPYMEATGSVRALSPEELAALDNPAPAVAPAKPKTFRQKLAAVVAGE